MASSASLSTSTLVTGEEGPSSSVQAGPPHARNPSSYGSAEDACGHGMGHEPRRKRCWAPYNDFDRLFWAARGKRPTHVDAKEWYNNPANQALLLACNSSLPTFDELKMHRQRFRVDKAQIRAYTNSKRMRAREMLAEERRHGGRAGAARASDSGASPSSSRSDDEARCERPARGATQLATMGTTVMVIRAAQRFKEVGDAAGAHSGSGALPRTTYQLQPSAFACPLVGSFDIGGSYDQAPSAEDEAMPLLGVERDSLEREAVEVLWLAQQVPQADAQLHLVGAPAAQQYHDTRCYLELSAAPGLGDGQLLGHGVQHGPSSVGSSVGQCYGYSSGSLPSLGSGGCTLSWALAPSSFHA